MPDGLPAIRGDHVSDLRVQFWSKSEKDVIPVIAHDLTGGQG